MAIPSDKKLLEQWNRHQMISEGSLDTQHRKAAENHAFYAGDKMAYSASVMDKGSKRMVVFNTVKPYIDSVAGFMVQLRRRPEYLARITDKEQQESYSSTLNDFSDYARDNANLSQLESKQNKEMLITGYGAIDTNVIYEMNPDGEVKGENIDYDDIFWDPQANEPNILDSRWLYRRKKFNRKEASKRFPGSSPGDFEGYIDDNDEEYLNDNSTWRKGQLRPDRKGAREDLVEVFYYQYWKLETYFRAENPLYELTDPELVLQLSQVLQVMQQNRLEENADGNIEDYFEFDPLAEFLIMTPSIKRDVVAAFGRFGIDIEVQRYNKKVFYTAIITGETVLDKFRSLDQQGFTIKFKTADYDYANDRWIGMVDSLKEPALYMNKSLTEMMYVIASNSKGGVMYEESAVDDTQKFEQQYATTKAAIQVNDGALSNGRIQPKATAAMPTGYENIHAISSQSMGQVTGINKEFLGSSENKQVSALMESQRIAQVVSTLACYFDSIALYQTEHARYMITLINVLIDNSAVRMIKITDNEGDVSFKEVSKDDLAEEYDVVISEAPTSQAQKEVTTNILVQVADKLLLSGQNIYPQVVDYLPIKEKVKRKLKEAMSPEPTPEQQQQQQALQKIQMEGQLMQLAKDKGDVSFKRAQTAKTMAEIPGTEADTDKTRADTIKSLAEGEQTQLENKTIQSTPINQLNVNI